MKAVNFYDCYYGKKPTIARVYERCYEAPHVHWAAR